MTRANLKDERWNTIFRQERIGDALQKQGWYLIQARTIKQKYGWEPRLLAKIDDHESLPAIFQDHDAVILSLANGRYVIVRVGNHGKPFFPTLPPIWESPRHIPLGDLPERYHTFRWKKAFTGESEAIDAAFASRLLHDFVGEEALTLTIRGRRRFSLKQKLPLRLRINRTLKEFPGLEFGSPQMEVDAGYEAPSSLYLIESKLHLTDNFNPRQVFFPSIYWQRQLRAKGSRKSVRPIYLLYTNHFYYLYELEIEDEAINAIHVRRQQWYILGEPPWTLRWLGELLAKTQLVPQPEIPFPQADLLPRIYDLLEALQRMGAMTIPQVAERQHFTERQAYYYASAAKWLGWAEIEKSQVTLTKAGRKLAKTPPYSRLEKTLQVLSCRPVFRSALILWHKQHKLPSQAQIGKWIEEAGARGEIKGLSGNTVHRRAQTARHWLQMLAPLVKS